ncbi:MULTISPECIES: hypothetical protein [Clostridium]|uniref:hypothetical protein n=1 Tax=Clostridium TaxID=1485 RepID=UPI0012FD6860|nr:MULTISPECIES: hypothetical protein [Clostridium]
MENIDYDRAIKKAEGNVKHEGMHLTDYERNLIKRTLIGEISNEEFLRLVYQEAIK